MRSVAKIRALPAADRWLLVKALVAVIAVRLRLKLRPFRPATEDAGRLNRTQETGLSPERIAWAVDRVSDRVGNATCLVRALAAQGMLGRYGFASCVRIGVVAEDPQKKGNGLIG